MKIYVSSVTEQLKDLPAFFEIQKGVGDDFLRLPFYLLLLTNYFFFPNFFIKTS